jgi:hypothetical protein
VRLTVQARVVDGLEAKLRARTQRQKAQILAEVAESGDRVFARVQDTVPRLTHYMAEHTLLIPTYNGYGYRVGWHARDFIGKRNPVTKQIITRFYPVDVHYGTKHMAGRDVITPATELERPRLIVNCVRILAAA